MKTVKYKLGEDRYTNTEYPATVIERNGVSYHRIEIGAGFGGNMVAYQRADGSDATMASNKPFTMPPIPHHAGVVDTQPEAPKAVEIPVTVDAPLSAGTWENVVEIPLMMKADIEAGNVQRATCEYYEGVIAEMQATIDKLRSQLATTQRRYQMWQRVAINGAKQHAKLKRKQDTDANASAIAKPTGEQKTFKQMIMEAEPEPPEATGHDTYDEYRMSVWRSGKSPYMAELGLFEALGNEYFDRLKESLKRDADKGVTNDG